MAHSQDEEDPAEPSINQRPRGFWAMLPRIVLISYVMGVSVNPLFFYVPIINGDKKCLGMDKKLMVTALVLRAVADCFLLGHIVYWLIACYRFFGMDSVCKLFRSIRFDVAVAHKVPWHSIFIQIFAILPIPQVLIALFVNKNRHISQTVMNVFLVLQFLPRIYALCQCFNSLTEIGLIGQWVKVAFNFFLYILTSHILGALWYFFSIQREISCWHRACGNNSSCARAFHCGNNISRNITLLDEFCFKNPPNATPFDFGIFFSSLHSDTTRSVNFLTKFLYSFWWGVRNLSNLGTNLETSTYVWENCFAILISVIGLPLFLYLIGNNVQIYMQMETVKLEEKAGKRRRQIRLKELEIKSWMERNEVPGSLRKEIIKKIREQLEINKEADLDNIFSILPWKTLNSLKQVLCISKLMEVPRLRDMNVIVLKKMCEFLEQVIYPENSFIVEKNEALDRMVLITEGTIQIYTTSTTTASNGTGSPSLPAIGRVFLEQGQVYGHEQLLSWASSPETDASLDNLPISEEYVKCDTKVVGFVLFANDLKTLVSECRYWWDLSSTTSGHEGVRSTISISTASRVGTAVRRFRRLNQPKDPAPNGDLTGYNSC